MDLSPVALAKILLPRAPGLVTTAILNKLSLSPNSSKQDTTTELVVKVVRTLLNRKSAVGKSQSLSLRDPGIKGPMWISKVTLPAPLADDTVRDSLVQAITALGDGSETYALPDARYVEGEWTGYRSGVDKNAPELDIPEGEKYARLMAEVESPVTILYFHGGAYFLMDPASHRIPTSRLAKLTKGRCFSVRYRLAPQHPFPTQILDALVAYLSLISPPPGSLHEAVLPSNIVFAGDSAGGNLSLVLLQTLLTLQREGVKTIKFHGQDVPISLPAGCSLNSPWMDISRSMPSIHSNAHFDYLEPPNAAAGLAPELPPDEVWPAKPPRFDLYCESSVLMHPLASPLAAGADLWKGSPPIQMCSGSEALEDEMEIVARRMHEAGVTVSFDGYHGYPHCFAMILMNSVAGKECFRRWAESITAAVAGTVEKTDSARWMKAFASPPQFDYVPFSEINALSDADVRAKLQAGKDFRMKREQEMRMERSGSATEQPKSRL